MGRLKEPLLVRIESFGDRVLDVVEALERTGCPRRVLDQMTGCGTAVGANAFEADEAMSRADFCKTIAIVLKELNEVRYWIRLVGRRQWIDRDRLGSLESEAAELKKVLGAILSRSRANGVRGI